MKNSLYPPGATNANVFQFFNAIAFQITLGSPMILYAKTLGATATVLGVIASLTPLLTIAQIPAARFIVRTGYRRFILGGWGLRTLFVFAVAVVPLLTFVNALGKMALLLFCLFGFNLLRGISSGAWLPWMTDLIPEEVRGRFLSRDQFFQNVGNVLALLVCAAILTGAARPWQFAAIFFLSAMGGAASLLFILRIPEIDAPERLARSTMRVPWREIITYPPFLRLTIFTLLWVFTVGAVGVFTVSYLKSRSGYGESAILLLSALYFAGALASLPWMGGLLDRIGSKLVLQCNMAIVLGYHLLWWLISARLFAPSLSFLAVIAFINGIAGSTFNLAHTRLVMNTMPPMGRSHFFAFFTVITSLGLGFSPIIWGLVIDAVGEWQRATGPLSWNRYSVFFFGVLLLLGAVLLGTFALQEPRDLRPRRDPSDRIFRGNLRRLLRLWQR